MILQRVRSAFSKDARFKPLEDLVNGQWDLTATLPVNGSSDHAPELINQLLKRLQTSVTEIATTAVALSRVAPELAQVASELEDGASAQAARAGQIASVSGEMAATVHDIAALSAEAAAFSSKATQIAKQLQDTSKGLSEVVDLISKIAAQTQIVSLNACVEAARAGEHGEAFAVVAAEMRRLAGQTKESAVRIETLLGGVRNGIGEVTAALGRAEENVTPAGDTDLSNSPDQQAMTLHRLVQRIAVSSQQQDAKVQSVTSDIQSIAQVIEKDSASATHLNELSREVHQYCDQLNTTVGVFRLAAHRTARQIVEKLSEEPALTCMDRERQEIFLKQAIEEHSFFELFYITNNYGIQVTSNIAAAGFQASYGSTGRGKNWSQRPWFIGAIGKRGLYTSDVYRSVATGHFCFTVSAPLYNASGDLVGVLGADVNFSNMLSSK